MEKKYGDLSNLKFISRLNKRCILNEGRLEEYERELGIKFPESDRKYIKSFMGTHPFNLCIDIKLENGEIIERRINTFAPLGKFYKDKLIQDVSEKQKEYLKKNEKEFINSLENIKNILSDKKIIPIANLRDSYLSFSDYGYGFLTSLEYEELIKSDANRLYYDFQVSRISMIHGAIGYDYRDGNCRVVYIGKEGVIELGKSIVELKNMIYTSSEEEDNKAKEEDIKLNMECRLSEMEYLDDNDEISLEEMYYDYEDTPEQIAEAEKKLGIKFPKKFKELRALGLKRISDYSKEIWEEGEIELMKELSVAEMIKEYKKLYDATDRYIRTKIEEEGKPPEYILPAKLIPLYQIKYTIYDDLYYKFECLYYHDDVPEDEPEVVAIEGYDVEEAFLAGEYDVKELQMIKLGSTYEEYLNSDYLLKPNLDLEEVKKEARIYGEDLYRINIGENLRRYKVEKKDEYKRRGRKNISVELLSEREKLKGKEFCKKINNGIVMDNIGEYEENVIEDIGEIEVYKLSKLMEYEQIEQQSNGIEIKKVLELCNRLSEKYGYEPVYIIEGEKVKIKELSRDEGVEIGEADYRDTEGFRIAPIYYRISGDEIEKERESIKRELRGRYLENINKRYSKEDLSICRTVSEDE